MPKKNSSSYLRYVLDDLFHEIPGITSRAMFGGYGLYQGGVIFGLIADDQLYFKVGESNLADYEKRGSKPFTYEMKNHKKTALSYWIVPGEILEDREELKSWIAKSVAVSLLTRSEKKAKAKR